MRGGAPTTLVLCQPKSKGELTTHTALERELVKVGGSTSSKPPFAPWTASFIVHTIFYYDFLALACLGTFYNVRMYGNGNVHPTNGMSAKDEPRSNDMETICHF